MNNSKIDREEFLKCVKDIARKYEYNYDYDKWLDSYMYDYLKDSISHESGFEKYYSSAYKYYDRPSLSFGVAQLFSSNEDTPYQRAAAQLERTQRNIPQENLDACSDDIGILFDGFK